MNYRALYERLIDRAKNRVLSCYSKQQNLLQHNYGKEQSEEWKLQKSKMFKGKRQSSEHIINRVASRKITLEAKLKRDYNEIVI